MSEKVTQGTVKGKLIVPQLIELIKKLKKVDSYIYLNYESEEIKSSVYLPAKDGVKTLSLESNTIFQNVTGLPDEAIRISFYDSNKVMTVMKQFLLSDNVNFTLNFDSVDDEIYATNFIVSNDSLNIKLICSDTEFMEMTEEQIVKAFNTSDEKFRMLMPIETQAKITDLIKLDNVKETVNFETNQNRIFLTGDNYNLQIASSVEDLGDQKVTLHKKFFNLLDSEDYNVTVCGSRTILESKDSNTKLLFANSQ